MIVYNNKTAQIEFPLVGDRKIVIPGKSYSIDFMPRVDTLELLVSIFTPEEIAFVVSGPTEYGVCASTKSKLTPNFVVNTIDEAYERFREKTVDTKIEEPVLKEKVIEPAPIPVVEEDTKVLVEELVSEDSKEDDAEASKKAKKDKKSKK